MGAFQNLKGHWFETTFKAVTMCNFPVTMVKYKGKIPKVGATEAKDIPEETYIFIEKQAEWSKKYLTKGWSKEVKMERYIVASIYPTHIPRFKVLREHARIFIAMQEIQRIL